MKKKKVGKIMIELDGVLTDINSLNKADYEQFLDAIIDLRKLYMSVVHPMSGRIIEGSMKSNRKP